MNLELIAAQATAPGASGANASAAPGGAALTIRNSRSAALLTRMWGAYQASGWVQWKAPSQHDNVRGYRAGVVAAEFNQRLPGGLSIKMQPQEVQEISIAGSAVAGDVETVCGLALYGDLPNVSARMANFDQVRTNDEFLTTINATITGTGAGFTGGEALNAETSLLRANRNYAVLGMTTNTNCPAIWFNGSDTGNVNVGCPGDAGDNESMKDFFITLSRSLGKPLIPVINSGNLASTTWGIVQDENNISPLLTMYLCLLDK